MFTRPRCRTTYKKNEYFMQNESLAFKKLNLVFHNVWNVIQQKNLIFKQNRKNAMLQKFNFL